jgi:hypothetical protein
MTNLNVPGLADVADVAAYMHAVGEAARAAARDVARADTNTKNLALHAMARPFAAARLRSSRRTWKTSRQQGRRDTTMRSSTA